MTIRWVKISLFGGTIMKTVVFGFFSVIVFLMCQIGTAQQGSFGVPVSGLLCLKGSKTLAETINRLHEALYSKASVQLHHYDDKIKDGPWVHSIMKLSNLEILGTSVCVTVHGRNGKLEDLPGAITGIQPGQPATFVVCPRHDRRKGKRNLSEIFHKVVYENPHAIPINIEVTGDLSAYHGPWIHDPRDVSDIQTVGAGIWHHICALVDAKFGKNPLIE